MHLMECDDDFIDKVLTAATEVHKRLGPGLLESVYQKALVIELSEQGLQIKSEFPVSVNYRGKDLGLGFRVDLLVEDSLVLELKSTEKLLDIHTAQLINYLKILNIKRGFLINFNRPLLKYGIKRVSI